MLRLLSALSVILVWSFGVVASAAEHTGTVLLVHTNDIHAHLRAGDSGTGGLPYVAGYIEQLRKNNKNILLLDGGDVLEKGDMVSWVTQGRIMYQAMNRIGYDAGVPGNHDFAFGPQALKRNAEIADFPLVCANPPWSDTGLPASTVVVVNNVRVGIIGLTVVGSSKGRLPALQRETQRLLPRTDLQIALCHLNSKTCRALSAAVPEIDVFVSGHSHEVLQQPIVVPKTGALIVQAGSLARYVGQWQLTVDLDQKKVLRYHGKLVPLTHVTTPCDKNMVVWIKQQERLVCPEAQRVVGNCQKVIQGEGLARLYGLALQRATKADVVLTHTSLLRGQLYPGPVDINDLFTTYVPGTRREVVEARLSGRQLQQIKQHAARGKGALIVQMKPGVGPLQDAKQYTVVLTRGLWESIRTQKGLGLETVKLHPLKIDVIKALADYLPTHDAE